MFIMDLVRTAVSSTMQLVRNYESKKVLCQLGLSHLPKMSTILLVLYMDVVTHCLHIYHTVYSVLSTKGIM